MARHFPQSATASSVWHGIFGPALWVAGQAGTLIGCQCALLQSLEGWRPADEAWAGGLVRGHQPRWENCGLAEEHMPRKVDHLTGGGWAYVEGLGVSATPSGRLFSALALRVETAQPLRKAKTERTRPSPYSNLAGNDWTSSRAAPPELWAKNAAWVCKGKIGLGSQNWART